MKVKFGKEKGTLGYNWSQEVRHSGLLVGYIRRAQGSDVYRYYRGRQNLLTPTYENSSLDAIKRQIEENP